MDSKALLLGTELADSRGDPIVEDPGTGSAPNKMKSTAFCSHHCLKQRSGCWKDEKVMGTGGDH